jgi:butyryl-CoA dehydrogenase
LNCGVVFFILIFKKKRKKYYINFKITIHAMDFNLTKTEKLFLQMIHEFAEKEVKPLAAEIDEQERFPIETVKKMAEIGLMGIPVPKEYGGAGGTNLVYSMAVEELSRVCATTGVLVSAHTSLCVAPIYENGTEEQKQKYLPKLCSGEWIGAFGLTEPNAGTDASAQQTTAVEDGDEYVLNGNKIFITNAGYAHVFIIFAMTDKSQGTRGISAFIVEAGTEGFTVGREEHKLGIRGSSTCELIFDNCRIPKSNLLGRLNRGFGLAMRTLDGGRIGIAAQALGIAQGAMDETVKYTKERKQFGTAISDFQNTRFQMADLHTKVEASRLLVRSAAFKKDTGVPYSVDAAMAKLFASETAMEVANKAIQFHGGYGYTREYPVERMLRDAKITEIYEGTSEVQRMVISANLFK